MTFNDNNYKINILGYQNIMYMLPKSTSSVYGHLTFNVSINLTATQFCSAHNTT